MFTAIGAQTDILWKRNRKVDYAISILRYFKASLPHSEAGRYKFSPNCFTPILTHFPQPEFRRFHFWMLKITAVTMKKQESDNCHCSVRRAEQLSSSLYLTLWCRPRHHKDWWQGVFLSCVTKSEEEGGQFTQKVLCYDNDMKWEHGLLWQKSPIKFSIGVKTKKF